MDVAMRSRLLSLVGAGAAQSTGVASVTSVAGRCHTPPRSTVTPSVTPVVVAKDEQNKRVTPATLITPQKWKRDRLQAFGEVAQGVAEYLTTIPASKR
jgi:hypothetical protein